MSSEQVRQVRVSFALNDAEQDGQHGKDAGRRSNGGQDDDSQGGEEVQHEYGSEDFGPDRRGPDQHCQDRPALDDGGPEQAQDRPALDDGGPERHGQQGQAEQHPQPHDADDRDPGEADPDESDPDESDPDESDPDEGEQVARRRDGWERSAEQLRQGLSDLGSRLELRSASRTAALFTAHVPAAVLSEAVRLSMSWVGRSAHRWAELTGSDGSVLRLTGEPRREEMDTILQWLSTNMGARGRRGTGG
jgi:hypothetical protein